ncbi:MAG: M48 family metalloprotease [Leptospiraceae bacterium]|nr:M48 family metalloprotease [Leptospiraceae bacterium]MCP5502211.1 M48 family metalloprotease [Leptospiraceae bacterium]
MRKFKFILLAVVLFTGFSFCSSSEEKEGSPDEAVVTDELKQEVKIGKALAARLVKKYGIVKNEGVTRYLNLMANSLGSVSQRPNLKMRVGILDTDEVNAFACGGGYVLVTKGTLKRMKNEAELAFVMAHEMAHMVLGHSVKVKKQGGFVEFIANFLGGGGALMNMAIEQASAEMEKQLLETGRSKEYELAADRDGLILASISMTYDYSAGIEYIKRSGAAASKEDELRNKTHPPYSERVAQMEGLVKEQGLPKSGKFNDARFQREMATLFSDSSSK